MIVRSLADCDVEAVVALYQAGLGVSRAGMSHVEEIAQRRQRDPELFLVAEDETGRVVGSAMGGYDGHRGSVHRMVVDTEHRRRGVGSLLMAELERCFRELGVVKVNFLVYRHNTAAREFWAALGYPEDPETVTHHKVLV